MFDDIHKSTIIVKDVKPPEIYKNDFDIPFDMTNTFRK